MNYKNEIIEMVKKIDDEKKLRKLYFIVKGFFEKLGLR